MSSPSKERLNFVSQLLAHHDGISTMAYQQILEALETQKETFGYNAKNQLRVAMFDARSYDIAAFNNEAHEPIQIIPIPSALNEVSAIQAKGCLAICVFVNDDCSELVIKKLAGYGVKLIALRCSGFNNVDLEACAHYQIDVVRVPEYSPFAVAEHAVALMMMLNRKLHQAYVRNKNGQYVLDGLVGFDMHGKTVGVVGVGKIGQCLINILLGFGCKVLAHDIHVNQALQASENIDYVALDTLFERSDIISLHTPLTKDTYHLIDDQALQKMQDKVMLINTSRGALIDTKALIKHLKAGKIGSAGLDVYEEEASIFFHDKSGEVITDDVFARLTTFNNVVITSHQGFLTNEALSNIADTTLLSLTEFMQGKKGKDLSYIVEIP